jgi:signal transduction histidine kinase
MASSMLNAQMDGIVSELEPAAQHKLAQQLCEWRETVELIQSSLDLCVQVLRNSPRGGPVDAPEPVPCIDLRASFESAAAIHLARHPGIEVTLQLHMDSPLLVLGQRSHWQHVLGNLVSNSLLHGFQGRGRGTIHLAASMLPGQRLLLNYYDDGIGLDAQARARLFEDGFSTRLGRGGNGLGMGIVRELVCKALGGQLTVHQPAKGFHISIETPC